MVYSLCKLVYGVSVVAGKFKDVLIDSKKFNGFLMSLGTLSSLRTFDLRQKCCGWAVWQRAVNSRECNDVPRLAVMYSFCHVALVYNRCGLTNVLPQETESS